MMSQLIIDIFFSTIFLLLLILMSKIKVKAFDNNGDSYRYTFLGISVLGVVSLLQLFGHQDLFNSVPFISEPVYREIFLGIGIVSGVTLMIAGASIWLPGKRKRTQKTEKYESTLPSSDIELTIFRSQNMRSLLKRVPQMVSSKFKFKSYTVFCRHNNLKKYICTDYKGLKDTEIRRVKEFVLSARSQKLQFEEITSKIPHDYYLPVMIKNQAQIIILFRRENGEILTEHEKGLLEDISHALSFRLSNEYTSKKEHFYSKCWKFSGHIKNILAAKNSISSNLPILHRLFNQAVGAEYLSLAVLGIEQANPKVYTVGINGNILLDGGNSLIMKNSYFRKIMTEKKPILIANINKDRNKVADSMFIGCGQCSLLAQPIIIDKKVVALLTLGHSAASHFSREDLSLTKVMAYSMTSAVESELNQRSILERDRCLAAINGFESAVRKATDIDSLLKSAANLLLNNLSTTMVRITTLDDFRTKLKTAAVETIRPMSDLNTGDSMLSKELTYWHQIVAEEGRLLLINQNDIESRMEKSERQALMFPGVQSALIVPIVVNGRTFGMITLGEMRAWERTSYNSTTISFCKTIAAKIADTIKLLQLSRMMTGTGNVKKARYNNEPEKNLLRRLKVPMTNLQGSLEILKIKGFQTKGETNRILSKMEESSNDIVNLLNDY